jgi:aspartyl protease family protein
LGHDRRLKILVVIIARVLTVLLILWLSLALLYGPSDADALSSSGAATHLLYIVGLLVLVALISAIPTLRGIGLVVVMMTLAVTGYAYRFEIRRVGEHVLGSLLPYRGEAVGKGSISFEAWPDGQFRIDAMVNGTPVMFVVDTGASDVVLTPGDAERLGYEPQDLDFSEAYTTANGGVMGAPIVLHEIAIGPIRMYDVVATVNGAPMPYSLLGVTFLDRLASYEVKDGALTLTQ